MLLPIARTFHVSSIACALNAIRGSGLVRHKLLTPRICSSRRAEDFGLPRCDPGHQLGALLGAIVALLPGMPVCWLMSEQPLASCNLTLGNSFDNLFWVDGRVCRAKFTATAEEVTKVLQ